MDMTRFEVLAEAYGADLRRWPAAEQAEAHALMTAEPKAARALLSAAEGLDDLLAASRAPQPSQALRDAILAAAPKARRQSVGLGFWLSGAGFATAAMAGMMVGGQVVTALTAADRADAVLAEILPDEAVDTLPLTVSSAADGDFA